MAARRRRRRALLAVLLVAAATAAATGLPRALAAPRPTVVEDAPDVPVTWECLAAGPTPGSVAAAAAGGDDAAHAAAVAAATPRLQALGARVAGSYKRLISASMTPSQAREAKASGTCQAMYRSVAATPTPPILLPGGARVPPLGAAPLHAAPAKAPPSPSPGQHGGLARGR